MRSGALPAALLCIALSLALGRSAARERWSGLGLFAVAAVAASFVPAPESWREPAFLGGWISLIVTAAAVYLPYGLPRPAGAALALNNGMWAGALVRLTGAPADLLWVLPCGLCALVFAQLIGRRAPVGLKVVSSWLIAIAVLAALLPFLPVTPGYMPDHLE